MLLHFWLATRPDRVGNWRLQARKRWPRAWGAGDFI